MAPHKRPSRLLNLSKSPKANKNITTQNAANSPLLRLPAEIRQRIYDFALAGKVLHIYQANDEDRTVLVPCIASCFDGSEGWEQRIVDGGFYWCGDGKSHPHRACRRLRQSHKSRRLQDMPLQLLQVCRQVYSEAALVPFKKNLFMLKVAIIFFLPKLVPAQARAITHLTSSGQFYRMDKLTSSSQFYRMDKLKGLRSLHFHLKKSDLIRRWSKFWLDVELDSFEATIKVSQLDLESIKITFALPKSGRIVICPDKLVTAKEFKEILAVYEKEILQQ